jgi:hypothetical protein
VSFVAELVRAIELNERFQFVVLAAEHRVDLQKVSEDALPHLVDVGLVSTWEDAVAHVLSDVVTLTIYDAFDRQPSAVDAFMNGINTHRDTMGGATCPATLLVHYPRVLGALVGRYADIMSCALRLSAP